MICKVSANLRQLSSLFIIQHHDFENQYETNMQIDINLLKHYMPTSLELDNKGVHLGNMSNNITNLDYTQLQVMIVEVI